MAQLVDNNGAFDPTNQGVVGSSPAGRAKIQRLSTSKPDAWPVCATFARPFIHRLGSRIVPFCLISAICNAQNRHSSDAIEHSIREAYEAPDIGASVVLGHRSRGMAE